jgi:xylulokinase
MSAVYLLGLDLGTSSLKAVVMDRAGHIVGLGAQDYAIAQSHPAWAEQDPEEWWRAAVVATRQALAAAGCAAGEIAAIGLAGQMHGTVLLDEAGQPLRPAILWADQRSAAVVAAATQRLGLETLGRLAANRLAVGFMAASLLWLAVHEPRTLAGARWALLPKDALRLRLTGVVVSEPSDASSTLLFDVAERGWSAALLREWRLPGEILPPLLDSSAIAGGLRPDAADALGLAAGTPVVAGGADQACQLLGSGLLAPGLLSCTIGTGGQLVSVLDAPTYDPALRLSTFCHCLPGTWYSMGAVLAAGLSLRWFRERFCPEASYDQLAAEAASVPPGAEGLLFLPYLVGERTPHFDPLARGAFVGLTLRHGRGHLVRAIMEGVAFAMRDGLEIMRGLGDAPQQLLAAGGGGASPLWRQILADVLALPVRSALGEERTAVGAGLLAGLGVGLYPDAGAACAEAVRYGPPTAPIPAAVARYAALYPLYRGLYGKLREDFERMNQD